MLVIHRIRIYINDREEALRLQAMRPHSFLSVVPNEQCCAVVSFWAPDDVALSDLKGFVAGLLVQSKAIYKVDVITQSYWQPYREEAFVHVSEKDV